MIRSEMATFRLRAAGAQWQEIDGEVIVLDNESWTYLAGNASAAVLWRALAKGATREGLVARLVERYGPSAGYGADVDDFLDQLRRWKLLESEA